MNLTKISVVVASLFTAGVLTACQSTNTQNDRDRSHKMSAEKKDHKASPEQREQMKKMHAEQREAKKQMKAACDGKVAGTTAQVKMGEKTIDGTCALVFKADRKDQKEVRGEFKPMRGEHRPMQGDMRGAMHGMNPNEPLTDAQRAEMTKQFDQRLAQRQAMQKAMVQACQSQKAGAPVQIKAGEKTINGKCEVRFQPNQAMMQMPAPTKAA